jgi:hypothetical protein
MVEKRLGSFVGIHGMHNLMLFYHTVVGKGQRIHRGVKNPLKYR